MNPIGLCLIFASCLVPLFPYIQFGSEHPVIPLAAQYLGLVSLILMAYAQIMATRFKIVEQVFGAMDKTYVLHKWVGILALITMLLHDNLGAEIKSLESNSALADFGEELGELGMNGVMILIGLSVALFIPYRWWRWTHKLMGIFFVLSAVHFVLVDKPLGNTDPAGLFVIVICLLGLGSYIIALLPMRLRRTFRYKVSAIEKTGDATAATLTPSGKPLDFRAGQFAFFRFDQNGLTETHPFTLSRGPTDEGSLRLTVKALGHYTNQFQDTLEIGTEVAVQGPYGRFGAANSKSPQIWVGAGIGITPFAALLSTWTKDMAPVELFYTFRGTANAPHLQEIRDAALRLPNVTLHEVDTTTAGRMSADVIKNTTVLPLAKAKILYCGPANLRDVLAKDLRAHGVSRRRFHYEEFEIRTDFWPLDRINRPAKAFVAPVLERVLPKGW